VVGVGFSVDGEGLLRTESIQIFGHGPTMPWAGGPRNV
jgi:hypothetical protein